MRPQRNGEFVIDRVAVVFVHESGKLSHHGFRRSHVGVDHIEAAEEPHAEDHVVVAWDAADAGFGEGDRMRVC